MTLEHKDPSWGNEGKIDQQWRRSCPLFNKPLHIPLRFPQKGPKYTSMGDNSSNKTPKIGNLERDVPWCPD